VEDKVYVAQTGSAMDRTVAELNIEHFKRLLAVEMDPAKRQTIERLLAEEKAKLSRTSPIASSEERKSPNRGRASHANEWDARARVVASWR
jgi:hypothetical protein